ncbi:MAG: Type 3-dehydroquinate dehydratase [Ilumatobacteraceae bacterium]|nr:Type 3-dehydroquinate dehydratase [Ilumatobacteraceae bacterium]
MTTTDTTTTADTTTEATTADTTIRISLLHGPNLNLLGQREPHIYGTNTLEDYVATATLAAEAFGLTIDAIQTNHEGDLVDAIHAARLQSAAIIINPGAFTHYAWSLHDALAAFGGPIIEVHISNPNAREAWRHTSVVSPVATGTIVGLGIHGYVLAVEAIAHRLGAERTA